MLLDRPRRRCEGRHGRLEGRALSLAQAAPGPHAPPRGPADNALLPRQHELGGQRTSRDPACLLAPDPFPGAQANMPEAQDEQGRGGQKGGVEVQGGRGGSFPGSRTLCPAAGTGPAESPHSCGEDRGGASGSPGAGRGEAALSLLRAPCREDQGLFPHPRSPEVSTDPSRHSHFPHNRGAGGPRNN